MLSGVHHTSLSALFTHTIQPSSRALVFAAFQRERETPIVSRALVDRLDPRFAARGAGVSLPVCSTSRCNSTPGGRRQSRRLPHRSENCPKVLSLSVPSLENLSCRGSKRTTRSDATHLCLGLPSGLESCLAFFFVDRRRQMARQSSM